MTTLLLIDLQNDFHPGGSLAIPTANEDAQRIAKLISRLQPDRIVATLDSHHALHIAHPHFWLDNQNHHPEPFTIITYAQVRDGIWKPRGDLQVAGVDETIFPGDFRLTDGSFDLPKYCIEYTRQLEQMGRFQLCIWPPHCLLGSSGHALLPVIYESLIDWSRSTGRSVEYVFKGEDLLTEMYSAICADVPISKQTSFNHHLTKSLLLSERLVVCGQAMSHCVNYTVRDIVRVAPDKSKIFVLVDCSSAVPGFEGAADKFLLDMREAGVHVSTSGDLEKL